MIGKPCHVLDVVALHYDCTMFPFEAPTGRILARCVFDLQVVFLSAAGVQGSLEDRGRRGSEGAAAVCPGDRHH